MLKRSRKTPVGILQGTGRPLHIIRHDAEKCNNNQEQEQFKTQRRPKQNRFHIPAQICVVVAYTN